jgi:HSP20 family molecular chaperone IbpA
MTSMLERLPGWPDLLGWVETGLPGTHVASGLHGIRIEEHFEDDRYVLCAELPGIDPDKDVHITVDDDLLTLRAERTERTTEKYRSEFRYGTLARTVRLPAGAKGGEAVAEYKDGVLTITVPVAEEAKEATTIPVRRT